MDSECKVLLVTGKTNIMRLTKNKGENHECNYGIWKKLSSIKIRNKSPSMTTIPVREQCYVHDKKLPGTD